MKLTTLVLLAFALGAPIHGQAADSGTKPESAEGIGARADAPGAPAGDAAEIAERLIQQEPTAAGSPSKGASEDEAVPMRDYNSRPWPAD